MHKSSPIFIMLCGLPCSGKTYTRNQILEIRNDFQVISTDDFIEMVAETNNSTYTKMFKDHIKSATEHSEFIFTDAVARYDNIICDRTNLTSESRNKNLAKLSNVYYKILFFLDIDKSVRQSRADKRNGKFISSNVIKDMEDRFQSPSITEGFDLLTTDFDLLKTILT